MTGASAAVLGRSCPHPRQSRLGLSLRQWAQTGPLMPPGRKPGRALHGLENKLTGRRPGLPGVVRPEVGSLEGGSTGRGEEEKQAPAPGERGRLPVTVGALCWSSSAPPQAPGREQREGGVPTEGPRLRRGLACCVGGDCWLMTAPHTSLERGATCPHILSRPASRVPPPLPWTDALSGFISWPPVVPRPLPGPLPASLPAQPLLTLIWGVT